MVLRGLAGDERTVGDVAPNVRSRRRSSTRSPIVVWPWNSAEPAMRRSRRSSSFPPARRTPRSRCAGRCARCARSGTGCRSSFRSPIDVTPVCARSMQVFAPISTSSPSSTIPTCGIFTSRPSRNAQPKPSLPTTAPACSTTRSPAMQRSARYARGWNMQSAPTTRVGADARRPAGARCRRRRARARRSRRAGRSRRPRRSARSGRRRRSDGRTARCGRGGSSAASSAASATRGRRHGQQRLRIGRRRIEQRLVGQHGRRARGERGAQIAFVDREGQRVRGRRRRSPRCRSIARPASPTTRPPARVAASSRRASRGDAGHGAGLGFSSILRIFSTSGVMSTPPYPTYWRVKT